MRNFLKKNCIPAMVFLVLAMAPNGLCAAGLLSLQNSGIELHYPRQEEKLASRMIREAAQMKSFLEKMGLALPERIHVVLVPGCLETGYQVQVIPLYRIRIALQPPGPLEDGAIEPDPWTYRLFCGLAGQAVFFQCHGVPGAARRLMGAVISPNRILPPWSIDGVCHLLWELYKERPGALSVSTLDESIRNTLAWPGLDRISNHPRIWPGSEFYRIWGRPFVRWLYRMYGWKPLLAFIRSHGAGVIPFEVGRKAEKIFGLDWEGLWQAFSAQARPPGRRQERALDTIGPEPVVRAGMSLAPGGGKAAGNGPAGKELKIVYKGSRPFLSICREPEGHRESIAAPAQVTALDGPVRGPEGQVAVAGCSGGNWDIWLYDGTWQKAVAAPGVQCHPAFGPGGLVFASDHSGRFQVYDSSWNLLSNCDTAALRPEGGYFYCLGPKGWERQRLQPAGRQRPPAAEPQAEPTGGNQATLAPGGRPYRLFSGMWPNYLAPDLFFDSSNLQLGLVTRAEDASGEAGWDAGLRYAFSQRYTAWQLGATFRPWSGRLTSYPLDYETGTGQVVAEARQEASLSWRILGDLSISLNGRRYGPLDSSSRLSGSQNEFWLEGKWSWSSDWLKTWFQVELIESRGPSVSGWLQLKPGRTKNWELSLFAGKSWGQTLSGHNTFRVGGDLTEGFFTRRTTRLFPVRGFPGNVLESEQAFSARAEVFVPLAAIHRGYGTFPVFWRNLQAGFFTDCGMATGRPAADQLLVGMGMELVASLELAWDIDADFHLAVAWPLAQPGFLDEQGPVLLLQIGRPL